MLTVVPASFGAARQAIGLRSKRLFTTPGCGSGPLFLHQLAHKHVDRVSCRRYGDLYESPQKWMCVIGSKGRLATGGSGGVGGQLVRAAAAMLPAVPH